MFSTRKQKCKFNSALFLCLRARRIAENGNVLMNIIYFGLSYEALLPRIALLEMLQAPVENERN